MESYHRLDDERKSLIFVGDGNLRQSLQDFVDELGAESVYFFGFKNRTEIPNFYAISDVLVLPSVRETWGIVVNEAMCFGLPVIVSEQVGAGRDLIIDGQNGYNVGIQIESLSQGLKAIAELSDEDRALMGLKSVETIEKWLHRDLAGSLVQYITLVGAQTPVQKADDSSDG